jgi:hypothetical protein
MSYGVIDKLTKADIARTAKLLLQHVVKEMEDIVTQGNSECSGRRSYP